MVGYHNPDYEYFGKFAARLDDVVNWLPARICGFLLVVSARFCRFDYQNAWRTMLFQHTLTASPNAGWTMSAAAGALGITLEKEGYYRLEGGPNLPARHDITRAIKLLRVAQYLTFVFIGGLIVIIQLIV
jgi:adenosylcobinamide-phosphate synthase